MKTYIVLASCKFDKPNPVVSLQVSKREREKEIWRLERRHNIIWSLGPHILLLALQILGGYLIAGSSNGMVCMWSMRSQEPEFFFQFQVFVHACARSLAPACVAGKKLILKS